MAEASGVTHNIEYFAYRIYFEDKSLIPVNFFSELAGTDAIDTWDNVMPTPGSTVTNIIKSNFKNRSGAEMFTGLFVEATNITRAIEIMDISGKIENASIHFEDDEIDVNEEVKEGDEKEKLIFKFKRWRIGVLPGEGILVVERRNSGYEKKLADYFSSWSHKWAARENGRQYKSVLVEPYLTGTAPADFLSGGSIGLIEFALSSDTLSEEKSFLDSDLRDLFKKDKNLVVSIEVKAKRGQSFHPDMTSLFIDFLKKHEDSIQKCSGRKVVSKRKSKPLDLINNLHNKQIALNDLTDATVLESIEEYLLELYEDEE